MRVPHFLTLVRIDALHFITACRSGLVHLTWVRATLRFDQDEFRQLARLMERVAGLPGPASLCEDDVLVVHRLGDESQVRVGPAALLLPPAEFEQLAAAIAEALARLDELLAAGVWEAAGEDEDLPATLDPTGRTPFSPN